MECEKCKAKPAVVHIAGNIRAGSGEPPDAETVHHFCETCGREFMQNNPALNEAVWSKPTPRVYMDFRPTTPPDPPVPEPQIDTTKRYDVYCIEPNRQISIYRNAQFKGAAVLLPSRGGRVHYPEFVELEQANGQSIFISRSSIVRFCDPGTTIVAEALNSNNPEVG